MRPVAIVFGGTKGIGRAIARKLLSNGYRVAVASRHEVNVAEATGEFGVSEEPVVLGIQCDVTSEQEVQHCFKLVEEQWATPYATINAAGINKDGLLIKADSSTIASIVNTNLIGAISTSKHAVRSLMRKRDGVIINIGSVVGLNGNPGQTVYSSSKSGLIGFTKSLAKEVGSKGIRANLVVPGFINTRMTTALSSLVEVKDAIPLQRFGEPEEVAELVHFLTKATYITGQVLIVDGGLHLM